MLAVDAFSSDAIPVHLITREALGVYLRHVKPDGIVAFHVSNRFLDLIPVVARLAQEHGAHACWCATIPTRRTTTRRSRTDWVLVSRDAAALEREAIVERGADGGRGPARVAHLDRRLLQPDPDPEVREVLDRRAPSCSSRRSPGFFLVGTMNCSRLAPSHMTSGLATSTEE